MTKIKICGLTRPEDAALAARLGAWALGVIFAPESPRRVSLERAVQVLEAGTKAAPGGAKRVGVFVNAGLNEIEEAVRACRLSAVQLHGEEAPEFCAQVERRTGVAVIKALPVFSEESVAGVVQFDTGFVLLDTYHPMRRGGTGEIFDWKLAAALPESIRTGRLILSGGLTPENVTAALLAVRPFAVDIASGVESGPGVKDPQKIKKLFETIRNFH